jgi:hypothetical protein
MDEKRPNRPLPASISRRIAPIQNLIPPLPQIKRRRVKNGTKASTQPGLA